MKFNTVVVLLFTSVLFLSCSKASKNSPKVQATVPDILPNTIAFTDTIKVMAYNVLGYGNGCQAGTSTLNAYLKTIVQYAQPDILSCEKMASFNPLASLPANLAEDITNNALNAAFPAKYAYIIPTNAVAANTVSVLFYNKLKFTFVKTETILANITDFNLYKLYYNDPNLAITRDTTFLYVLVNHTQSGSSSIARDIQLTSIMQKLRSKFGYFPNLISMGDFNTHNSLERGYQAMISAADTSTMMSDPPFFPDRLLKYPAEWENNTSLFSSYLTTTTRALATVPNACGTAGGAKSWYDHILISPLLVNGTNYMRYLPNSYQTIGNDGNRTGVDVISTTPIQNASAPKAVINAIYQFSDKYPIAIKLIVKANRNAYSVNDPIEKN